MSKYECPNCGGGFEKPAWNERTEFEPACVWCGNMMKFLSKTPDGNEV